MAKICDICGGKIGFHAFHCQDGMICKNCYRIVSGNYANTITKMTLVELKKRYIQNAQPLEMGEDGFQITKKVGAFLLLDEKNRKFCVLNNQKMTGRNTRPEIYPYAALERAQLIADPQLSEEQLKTLAANRDSDTVVRKLTVCLWLKNGSRREITVIPTPVRVSSFAFRQAYKVAEELLDCLAGIR